MFRFLTLVFVLGAVAAAPRSREEVEEFKKFLEKAKPSNGSLEDAMALNPLASAWENSGKYQGDIVLTEEQIEQMVEEYANPDMSRNAIRRPGGLWPSRTVVWDFAPGQLTVAQQNQVTDAFHMFNTRTCIRFRRRTNENTYVLVTGRQDGCYATVGHWQNTVHTFNLARGCFQPLIIIHEWLHIVGFWHMHQVYSRYDHVWINWHNMSPGSEFNFNRFSAAEVDMVRLPYEYASNQHYGSHAFSRNGQPTIVARWAGGENMGQLSFVTAFDILRVNRLYGCPGAWNSAVRAEDINKPAYFGPDSDQEQPLQEQLFDEQPLEEQPLQEQLFDEQPLEEQPLQEQLFDEQLFDEQPLEEQPLEEQLFDEQPLEEQPQEEQTDQEQQFQEELLEINEQ